MKARTSLKLGLFTILAVAAVVATAVGLGLRLQRGAEVPYHTYFDESVQGLSLDAPVKYRGVLIGRVADIEIAPDRRHVDVTMSLAARDLRRLGLSVWHTSSGRSREQIAVAGELRAQLGSQGITGVRFVNLDLFDPATNPVVPLPFPTADDTIPAATSLMEGIEESLTRMLDRLPAVLDAMLGTLAQIQRSFESIDRAHIPESIATILANTNHAVTDLRAVLRQVGQAGLPDRTARAVDDADRAMVKLATVLDRIGGDGGLVGSTKQAADSIDELGRRVGDSTDELDHTLRDIGEAARAVRDLADAIDRDPDMLLKGRARRGSR